MPEALRPYRKLLVAVTTFLGVLLAQGVFRDEAAIYVSAALAALGSVGIYAVENDPLPGKPEVPTH